MDTVGGKAGGMLMRRAAKVAGLATAVALAAGGCGSGFGGIYDLPLPGGADLGSHPYTVRAEFANVRDLVPQAAVKVNDVAIGRVSKISLPRGSWTAEVTLQVNGKVHLPANAYARLVQSSLLGEKYIALSAPTDGSGQGNLGDGSVIPLSRTNRDPEVEEVFGALSLLLNGGGLPQLKTITVELNKTFSGNEPQIRSLLAEVNKFTSGLNDHRGDITNALDQLNRLATNLAGRQQQIGTVLSDLSPGLKVLDEQRGELVTMLHSLEDLGVVADRILKASREDMVADLRSLGPILQNLADAGQNLPKSLQVLLTYPFSDEALKAVKGDYLNSYLTITAAPGTAIIPPLVVPNGQTPQSGQGGATGGRSGTAPPAAPLPLPTTGSPTVSPSTQNPSSSGVPSSPGSVLPSLNPPSPVPSSTSPSATGGR